MATPKTKANRTTEIIIVILVIICFILIVVDMVGNVSVEINWETSQILSHLMFFVQSQPIYL
jgi:hypothetical protein